MRDPLTKPQRKVIEAMKNGDAFKLLLQVKYALMRKELLYFNQWTGEYELTEKGLSI